MTLAPLFMSTVHGAMHIDKGMPREDAGGKLEKENYRIFVTADGHGSSECCRSAQGSQIAVDITIEKLSSFADQVMGTSIEQELITGSKQASIVNKLVTTIFSLWYEALEKDVKENPFTEEEYESAGSVSQYYRKNLALEHAYGTTLLAGLMTDKFLLLIQQGDGRSIVFDKNGRAYEPVPWDDRCEGNFTTSLSDEDAIPSCRYAVLPMTEDKPLAAFLCSDGVEDSFSRMDSTYGFCRKLLKICCDDGVSSMEEQLPDILNDLSKNGSRDDITVSGFVYADEIRPFLEGFAKEDEKINLEVQLQRVNDRLVSMSRKREYLKGECEKAAQNSMNAISFFKKKKEQFEQVDKSFLELMRSKKTLENDVQVANNSVKESCDKETQIRNEYEEYENRYQEYAHQKVELERKISLLAADLRIDKEEPQKDTNAEIVIDGSAENPIVDNMLEEQADTSIEESEVNVEPEVQGASDEAEETTDEEIVEAFDEVEQELEEEAETTVTEVPLAKVSAEEKADTEESSDWKDEIQDEEEKQTVDVNTED